MSIAETVKPENPSAPTVQNVPLNGASAGTTETPESDPSNQSFARRTLAAFHYRDFRVQWLGACTSSIGTWMQNVAENWLVLSITGSAFYLGLDAFLQQLPIILFMLIGGVLADRFDRRKTLIVSQCIQMASAFSLAFLVFMYGTQTPVWMILCLSFMTGTAQAFGGPAYQSLVPSLVDKKDLPNAIALNTIQFNLARVIGPILAAIVMNAYGSVTCFTLNGLSYVVVIFTLLSLTVKHIPSTGKKNMMAEMKSGLDYVRNSRPVLELTFLAACMTFLSFAVLTFLPIFAKQIFHKEAGTFSMLMAISGVGSVFGALSVASRNKTKHMAAVTLVVQAISGVLIVSFAWSRVLWLSGLLLFLNGAALMVCFSSITSLIQLITTNELRGRVMSIYMVAFRGGMPLGSLISGYFASRIGAPIVLTVNGILLTTVAFYFMARSKGLRGL
jgi:predicted MFS family arabinose efflux permease